MSRDILLQRKNRYMSRDILLFRCVSEVQICVPWHSTFSSCFRRSTDKCPVTFYCTRSTDKCPVTFWCTWSTDNSPVAFYCTGSTDSCPAETTRVFRRCDPWWLPFNIFVGEYDTSRVCGRDISWNRPATSCSSPSWCLIGSSIKYIGGPSL